MEAAVQSPGRVLPGDLQPDRFRFYSTRLHDGVDRRDELSDRTPLAAAHLPLELPASCTEERDSVLEALKRLGFTDHRHALDQWRADGLSGHCHPQQPKKLPGF
jgi:hypothetical protein